MENVTMSALMQVSRKSEEIISETASVHIKLKYYEYFSSARYVHDGEYVAATSNSYQETIKNTIRAKQTSQC